MTMFKLFPRDELIKFFKNKSVAIFGSAPHCVSCNTQEKINKYDLIVRVNNYKIKGLIHKVGNRTDVHYSFFGTSIKKNLHDLRAEKCRLFMCKCPNEDNVHEGKNSITGSWKWIYNNRDDYFNKSNIPVYVPDVSEYMDQFKLLKRHIPTTGFSAIWTILNLNVCSEIYVTGFDFFSSGFHNINEKWIDKGKGDPVRHMPEIESLILHNLSKKYNNLKFDKITGLLIKNNVYAYGEICKDYEIR